MKNKIALFFVVLNIAMATSPILAGTEKPNHSRGIQIPHRNTKILQQQQEHQRLRRLTLEVLKAGLWFPIWVCFANQVK